jgi:osmoprotectant transport system ATP-binding protein
MVLTAKKVTKHYGSTRALNEVSVEFPEGRVSILLGPSGSGKSTLLRLLNRMIEPDSGKIFVDGWDASEMDPIALRRNMGYVVQGIGLFPILRWLKISALLRSFLAGPRKEARRGLKSC